MTNIFEEQYLYGDNSMVDSCITSDDCILTSIGPRGEKGDTGARGPKGEKGDIGETGATGAQGPRGERGEQGPRGDIGPKGDTGAQGLRGPVGPEGPQGPQGIQGPTGATGAQGPQGIQGVRGPKGDIGPGFRLKGEVERQEDIVGEHKEGDCYFITSTKHVVIWTGSEWIDLGNIKGPQGEEGPTGPQGPTGATGPQGPTGATGPQGETGPQGPKGDVGEAAIIDSKVSNVNTWSSKQIIDHLLQDNEWKVYNNEETLTDAANGYIKNLQIEGKTEKSENSVNGVGVRVDNGYKITINTHNEGSTKTSTSEIILQDQLQGIGDIKDRLYFDEGYKVEKKNTKITLDILEDVEIINKNNGETTMYFETTPLKIPIPKGNTINSHTGICNRFELLYVWGASELEGLTLWNNKKIGIRIKKDKLKAQSVEGFKEWLKENKVELAYQLATPTTIDTQIKAELLPQTYKNKTYISVDSGVKPTLKGEYPIDDFKKKIDEILISHNLIQPPHTTLEELEEDEPTTLEEFSDDPTTLEEV